MTTHHHSSAPERTAPTAGTGPAPVTRRRRPRPNGDAGMVSAFLIAMLLGLFAVAGLALDPGLALADKSRALGVAEEAARAGAQQLNLTTYRTTGALQLDPAAAQSAADRYLTLEHATGTVTVAGNTVTVTVTAIYHTQLWQLVGVDTLTVHATGHASPVRQT
jgi:Flp pilus assembly protein TadG